MRTTISIIAILIFTIFGNRNVIAQESPTAESIDSFYTVMEGINWGDFQVVHGKKESDCWENQPDVLRYLQNKRLVRRTHYDTALKNLRKLFEEVNSIMEGDNFEAKGDSEINTEGEMKIDKLFLSFSESANPSEFVNNVRARRGLNQSDRFENNETVDFAQLYGLFRNAEKTALTVKFPMYELKQCKITETMNLTPVRLGPTRVIWNVSLDVEQVCPCRTSVDISGRITRNYNLELEVVSTIEDNNINTIKFWPPDENKGKPRLKRGFENCCGEPRQDRLPEPKERPRKKIKKVGSIWTPPNGTTRIAAVGTVRDETVMMTSRGTIGGTVIVENKDGEIVAEATPDENGKFSIDFGQLALGTAATQIVLTALDVNGKPQTSTAVEYLPGPVGEVSGKPELTVPEIPFVEQETIGQLQGSNFGDAAEVVIKPQDNEEILTETVSASGDLVQYYADVPVGPAEVYVQNEFGQSEPIELGIYKLGVGAEKMNLSRNESTRINAVFTGLPEGTKIIFTNRSANIRIKPIGQGISKGNEVVFLVRDTLGEVSLNVKAKQAGGWNVDYRLEFPH